MKRWRDIETYWGFPVGPTEAFDSDSKDQRPRKGVAMIVAIMVIATMLIFTADMIVNSAVSLQLAAGNRDRTKAEYMAKSGLNMAMFLISADLGVDLVEYQTSKKVPTDGNSDIWSMMNGLPIGGETLEMVSEMAEQFDLSKVNDSDVLDQMKLFDGQFAVVVSDELRKINVNYCGEGLAEECLGMLEALMSCPAEKEFLSKRKLNAREVAANIKDWIDPNTNAVEGWASSGSEDAPYNSRDPKVAPKNAPLDSLEELKQVAGWDDDMHKVFSPFLTVYPVPEMGVQKKPKININTANREMLACLLPDSTTTCAEISAKFTNPTEKEDEPSDVSSNADIQKRLREVFCENDTKKAKWFGYRTDTFSIEATGAVGDQEATIRAIAKRGMPDSFDKRDGFKGSYKFLSWKMR